MQHAQDDANWTVGLTGSFRSKQFLIVLQETSLYNQELLHKLGTAYAAAVVGFIQHHNMQLEGGQWLASYPLPPATIQPSQRDSFVTESLCPKAKEAIQATACIPVLRADGSTG